MELFESKKTKGIKSQIANLVAIAQLDGDFSHAEKKLIFEIGERNGISKERVKEIIKSEDPIKFKMPENDALRFDRLYEAIEMMLTDAEHEEEKIDFCIELAIKLGVRMAVAGVLVKKIIAGMKDKVSRKDIKVDCANFLNY
jgi:3-oxoacyl-[acyl-carrier-protein] synthase III